MPTKYLSQTVLAFLLTALAAVCLAQETIPLTGREVDGESLIGQVTTTVAIGTNGIAKKEFANDIGRLVMMVGDGKVWPDRTGDDVIDEMDWEPVRKGQGFTVKANVGDGKVDYSFMVDDITKKSVSLYSITCREGKYAGQRIRIFDSGGNGRYDDLGSDEVVYGDPGIRSFLMKTLLLDGKCFTMEIIKNGEALKLTPFKGKIDRLELKYSSPTVRSTIGLASVDGSSRASVTDRHSSQIIPGEYRISSCETHIERHGTLYEFWGSKTTQSSLVTITNGLNKLNVGTPFELKFVAGPGKSRSDEIILAGIWLEGIGGERYSLVHRKGGRERKYEVSLTAHIQDGTSKTSLRMDNGRRDSFKSSRVFLSGNPLGKNAEFVLQIDSPAFGTLKTAVPFLSITNPASRSLEYKLAAYSQGWDIADAERLEVHEHRLKKNPDNALRMNALSWFLLTCEDESLHDYPRALDLAKRAVELSNESNEHILDTLAVACYKTYDFEGAARYSRMAADMDPSHAAIVTRAKEYEAELKEEMEPDAHDSVDDEFRDAGEEGEDW